MNRRIGTPPIPHENIFVDDVLKNQQLERKQYMIRTELTIFALNEKTCLQFSASRPVSVFSRRKGFLYLIFNPSSALTLKSPFYLHHHTYKNHGELTTSFSFAWISSDVSFLL